MSNITGSHKHFFILIFCIFRDLRTFFYKKNWCSFSESYLIQLSYKNYDKKTHGFLLWLAIGHHVRNTAVILVHKELGDHGVLIFLLKSMQLYSSDVCATRNSVIRRKALCGNLSIPARAGTLSKWWQRKFQWIVFCI